MSKDPFTGAIYERTERVFYHAGLDVYLVTGQPKYEGGRRAYVALKSAHTLTPEQNAKLRDIAEDFSLGKSRLTVSVDSHHQRVSIYDQATKEHSSVALAELSPAVQAQYPYRKVPDFFDKLGL